MSANSSSLLSQSNEVSGKLSSSFPIESSSEKSTINQISSLQLNKKRSIGNNDTSSFSKRLHVDNEIIQTEDMTNIIPSIDIKNFMSRSSILKVATLLNKSVAFAEKFDNCETFDLIMFCVEHLDINDIHTMSSQFGINVGKYEDDKLILLLCHNIYNKYFGAIAVGDIICKKFGTDEFFGIIECICQETSNCKVRYTDNDIEVITKHEALLHRVYYDSIWKTGCESIAAAIQNGRMKNNIGVFESEKDLKSFWTRQIIDETVEIENIKQYMYSLLCCNRQFLHHFGYSELESRTTIMSKIDKSLFTTSIINESRRIYNDVFRSSSRVYIRKGSYMFCSGSILHYNPNYNTFSIKIFDRNGDNKVVSLPPDYIIPIDSINPELILSKKKDVVSISYIIKEMNNVFTTHKLEFNMKLFMKVYLNVPRINNGYMKRDESTISYIYESVTKIESQSAPLYDKFFNNLVLHNINCYESVDGGSDHIFTLPSSLSINELINCSYGLELFDRSSSSVEYNNDLYKKIQIDPIVITKRSLHSLLPNRYLNNEIVDFAIFWLSLDHKDIMVFRPSFLHMLITKGGINIMKSFSSRGNSMFDKKLLFFPFHDRIKDKWSFFLIINPRLINEKVRNGKRTILLKSHSSKELKQVSKCLCAWLNLMYQQEQEQDNPYGRCFIGFNDRLFDNILIPRNVWDYDSSVIMLIVIDLLLSQLDLRSLCGETISLLIDRHFNVVNVDLLTNCRLRLYELVCKLGELFNISNRNAVCINFDDAITSFEVETCQDSNSSQTDSKKNVSNDSSYDNNCKLGDKDDSISNGCLSEQTKDYVNVHQSFYTNDGSESFAYGRTLQSGYIIGYRLASDDEGHTTKVATIVNIFHLEDGFGYKIILDNNDRFDNDRHVLCIKEFKLSNGTTLPNSKPVWMKCNQYNIVPSLGLSEKSTSIRNSRRIRTCTGHMQSQVNDSQRRRKKENIILDSMQPCHISWRGIKPEQKDQYSDLVNDLYTEFMNYGSLDFFYETDIIGSKNSSDFLQKLKKLRKKLKIYEDVGRVYLNIQSSVYYYYRGHNNGFLTMREMKVKEEMFHFEYLNMCLNIIKCPTCLENKMVSIISDVEQERYANGKKCPACTTSKEIKINSNHYLDTNRHPIWYERNSDGSYKLDGDGFRIIRFDIPSVLLNLTMAEKLLIRRFQPFIPTSHLKGGVYGIKGHCVSFEQNIYEVCDELPRQRKSVVTYIRWISNKESSHPQPKQLKVRRDNVLSALKWLKVHHSGYSKITIAEKNLDWIGDKDSDNITMHANDVYINKSKISSEECKQDNGVSKEDFVSIGHVVDEDEIVNSAMVQNQRSLFPNKETAEPINELIEMKKIMGEIGDCILFPSADDEPVSEYNLTLQVMVNTFPWLFPGGIGDIWDSKRGKIDIVHWARHLLRYYDGRFSRDQLFTLYVYNTIIRHRNNEQGYFFYKSDYFLKNDPPTLSQLRKQIINGNDSFARMLQYYSKSIRGSDGYWRSKSHELEQWINHHLSLGHGPPTFFITLSCAENWWPDLRRLMSSLERNAGNINEADSLDKDDFTTMKRAVKRYPLFVNEFFMMRATNLMETVIKKAFRLKHYWGRVEFAPGRGQIHLHILAISEDHAYLKAYRSATTIEDQALVVSSYMEEIFSYTADLAVDDQKKFPDPISSPLKKRYSEVSDLDQISDHCELAEDCMCHKCNAYCLHYSNKNQKCRECNKGFGKESEPGNEQTDGMPLIQTSILQIDKKGIKHLMMKRNHSKWLVQHSKTLLQIWRGNVDVKCLIFNTDPDWPNLNEIDAIIAYICAYTVKKSKSMKEEREIIQNLILWCCDSELSNGTNVAKKALHKLMGQRLVPLQEAVHEIMGFDLVFTSDIFHHVGLAKCQKLLTPKMQKQKNKSADDLITAYRNRDEADSTLSLQKFYYYNFLKSKKVQEEDFNYHILLGEGLNYKPVYPPDYNYARGILLLHKPWGRDMDLKTIFDDESLTIRTFLTMIDQRTVPSFVVTQYHMVQAQTQAKRIEVLSKVSVPSKANLDDMDEEELDQYIAHQNCSMLNEKDRRNVISSIDGVPVNIGIGTDWSKGFDLFERKLTSDGRFYLDDCKESFYSNINKIVTSPEMLRLPLKTNGKKYEINELQGVQRTIVLAAVDTIVKFLNNSEDYKPLRATILGSAGTGKSYVINTLTTVIRELTQCNDTVFVCAPSGAAAYNVGGTTLHRAFCISIDENGKSKKDLYLCEEVRMTLLKRLERLLVLIVDERSMAASETVAKTESHVRHFVHGGKSNEEYWGGVPVVLIFGDDYQLPPVITTGAISAFNKKNLKNTIHRKPLNKYDQLHTHHGDYLFTENLVDDVFILTGNRRVNENDTEFMELLSRLRIGKPNENDVAKLSKLHISNYSPDFQTDLEENGRVMYLSATNKIKDELNNKKLRVLSKNKNVPIARIRCKYGSSFDKDDVKFSHFRNVQDFIKNTDIAVGARVALSENIIPELSLFNGASDGTVIDIKYINVEGPNDDQNYQLPEYVVVDFPRFKPPFGMEPWDKKNPTHVPIPMLSRDCCYKCCYVDFCPIVPAWAVSIHKAQGMEAGERKHDYINKVIIDPGPLNFEQKNTPGLLYVSASRARSIGNFLEEFPTDSSLYWFGPNMSENRIRNCSTKKQDSTNNRITCKRVQDRENWVRFLISRSNQTLNNKYTQSSIDNIARSSLKYALNKRFNLDEINERIMIMKNSPNETWKTLKRSEKYTVPKSFFTL